MMCQKKARDLELVFHYQKIELLDSLKLARMRATFVTHSDTCHRHVSECLNYRSCRTRILTVLHTVQVSALVRLPRPRLGLPVRGLPASRPAWRTPAAQPTRSTVTMIEGRPGSAGDVPGTSARGGSLTILIVSLRAARYHQ